MYQGLKLQELADRIFQDEKDKDDYIAPTNKLEMVPQFDAGRAIFNGVSLVIEGNGTVAINAHAHGQIAERLKIPRAYYNRMLETQPELLATNVNCWFQEEPERRMIRTLGGTCRAFMSDKYKPLDNIMIAGAALPALREVPQVEVRSSQITDLRLYLQATTPKVQGDVKVGEPVQAGVIISNSEVGAGRFSVESMLYFLVCKNGMVRGHGLKKTHIGRSVGSDDEVIHGYFKEDTVEAANSALLLKVRDAVAHCFNPQLFETELEKVQATTERRLPSKAVDQTIERLTSRYDMNETERFGILDKLREGNDFTQFGVAAAITNLANDVGEADYDRAVDMERIGSQVIDLHSIEWGRIIDV